MEYLILIIGAVMVYSVAAKVSIKLYGWILLSSILLITCGLVLTWFEKTMIGTLFFMTLAAIALETFAYYFTKISAKSNVGTFAALAGVGNRQGWAVIALVFYIYIIITVLASGEPIALTS